MRNLFTDLIDPVTSTDGTELFDRPTNCKIEPAPAPGFSTLRNIVYRGQHYSDVGASCGCKDLRALVFWPLIYTNCAKHGVVEIGYLRRATGVNGRPA